MRYVWRIVVSFVLAVLATAIFSGGLTWICLGPLGDVFFSFWGMLGAAAVAVIVACAVLGIIVGICGIWAGLEEAE